MQQQQQQYFLFWTASVCVQAVLLKQIHASCQLEGKGLVMTQPAMIECDGTQHDPCWFQMQSVLYSIFADFTRSR